MQWLYAICLFVGIFISLMFVSLLMACMLVKREGKEHNRFLAMVYLLAWLITLLFNSFTVTWLMI